MSNFRGHASGKNSGGSCVPATEEQWRAYCQSFPEDTPAQLLQQAIRNDQPHLVLGALRNTKLDINAPCEPDVHGSLSPLMVALYANNWRITDVLLQESSLSLSHSLPEYDTWGWARTSSLEILQRFLEHSQADVNQQDGNGCTLLHEVVRDIRGKDKLRFLLQQNGCQIDIEQADGTSPLYRAALAGNGTAVGLLLEHDVNVNNHNRDNRWSVLHVAVANNAGGIVDNLLASQGIAVNARDDMDNTPLHIASERGFWRISARLLRQPDIEINSKNNWGWTALHAAAFAGHQAVVKQLLSRSEVQVNFVDQDRQTALHWAVHNGQTKVAKLLAKQSGTNLYITNRVAGHTALNIAQALGHAEIIDFLQVLMNAHPQLDELSSDDDYRPPKFESDFPEPIRPLVPEVLRKVDEGTDKGG